MTSLVRFLAVAILLGAMLMPAVVARAASGSDDPPAAGTTPAPETSPAPEASPAPATTPAPSATVTTPAADTEPVVTTPAPGTTPAIAPTPETVTTPEVGSPAIDFNLITEDGKSTKLMDYRGKWVVLYFYPKDFTAGCTIEAHNFQRDLAKYHKLNAVVLGVSVDTPESHKEFCNKEKLNFKLLSDPQGKVSAQYGSVMEYKGAKMSARNTFIITPEGKIARVFTKVNPTEHSEGVLAALDELQKG